MKRIWIALLPLVFIGQAVLGQQEPMWTKYMFNSMAFNPGYAGSNEYLSLGLVHRSQWHEIEGAPQTQSFTAHALLRDRKVGIGFSLVNDRIGPTNTTGANLVYAYRIPVKNYHLSIGLQAGIENYRADWTQLQLAENMDEAFEMNVNSMLPNFGAGIYLYSKYSYFGFSVPFLVEYDLRSNVQTNIYSRQVRHYYFMAGVAIPVAGDALVFKPSFLFKNVGLDKKASKIDAFRDIGAPNEFDIDLSLLFHERFWLGTSFRSSLEKVAGGKSSHDSADIWVSYFMENGFRLGLAYDYPLSELSTVTSGAFEVMLGYEFNFNERKVATPRYF